jgi:hypothetical protein
VGPADGAGASDLSNPIEGEEKSQIIEALNNALRSDNPLSGQVGEGSG